METGKSNLKLRGKIVLDTNTKLIHMLGLEDRTLKQLLQMYSCVKKVNLRHENNLYINYIYMYINYILTCDIIYKRICQSN